MSNRNNRKMANTLPYPKGKQEMSFHYIGNGSYCYANSTAMALSATGKDYDPGYIEALTTVGVGAISLGDPNQPMTFFSATLPNEGIGIALTNLGYECEHYRQPKQSADSDMAFAQLRQLLQHGPVIIGPTDMGYLLYHHNYKDLYGADHYVCVYAIDGDTVRIQDPQWYPYASLSIAEFTKAWQAIAIEYVSDSYQMWGNLRQVRQPSADEVYEATEAQIRSVVAQQQGDKEPWLVEVGPAAIQAIAEKVKDGVPDYLKGQLTYFLLPLGAKRCSDYANFYAPYDVERARLKNAQGQAFGDSYVAMMRSDYAAMAEALHHAADIEQQFQQASMRERQAVAV